MSVLKNNEENKQKKTRKMSLPLIQINGKCEVFSFLCP